MICAGSGGVGKTTTSAAIATGLAARGARVAVVTIDPARRLADALGLDELAGDPERVDPARFASAGLGLKGELWAMTLDPKRTFDELIERLAPDRRSREEVLSNRIYQQLSGAVAGSQEFTAVAKLYELNASGRFDVLVLDTPPSRNALDFLDAPDRLTGFLEGRALRMLLTPSGLAARVVGRGTGVVFGVLERLTGVDLLQDVSVFLRALGGLMEGFRERAEGVRRLLADPATTFLVVTSPEREPVEEAIFFREKLRESRMPFGGLIVNRVNRLDRGFEPLPDPEAVVAELGPELGAALAAKVGRTYAEAVALAERDTAAIERLRCATGDEEPVLVPELDGDVHDVGGLLAVHGHLFPS
ncbi:MAG: AAA family ATPase [Solirubrobacteraceae bacterium]|nr:AAA family ATPase [Solirubrobacteraceae bacterium]